MSGFSPDHAGADVRVSPNFGPRRGPFRPDMIVLHYTGMASGEGAEAWLCDPASEVSSHYLVHKDGRIVQMVRESDRAWHAGKSFWRGHADINSASALCSSILTTVSFIFTGSQNLQLGCRIHQGSQHTHGEC